MPVYNTSTAATVLGVTPKWLDNLLSHNDIDGLADDSQGVARRLSLSTITVLALAKDLIDSIGLPAPASLRLAQRILEAPALELAVSPTLRISATAEILRTEVLGKLAHAVEMTPTPRRGRPPKR